METDLNAVFLIFENKLLAGVGIEFIALFILMFKIIFRKYFYFILNYVFVRISRCGTSPPEIYATRTASNSTLIP